MSTTRAGCALPDSPLAREIPGLDACVHCGFCLTACPTYLALEDENDSPRGRIVLMRALLEGALDPMDDAVREPIARCLGCRACETACPSGVPYGQLLEATRATLADARALPVVVRAALRLFERPAVLRAVMALARAFRSTGIPRLLARLPGRIGFANAMLAATQRALPERPYLAAPASGAPVRDRVALLDGCVMDGLFRPTNEATARVLTVNGYRVQPAPAQRCCGALHAHAGDLAGAQALARANISAFDATAVDVVCANAAGCGAALKSYGHWLVDDPAWADRARAFAARVRDASELLADAGPAPGGAIPGRITCDAPCHQQHGQRLTRQPAQVLAAIPRLDVVPLADADQCCGAAGIYNLIEPATSNAVLAPKVARILATGATLVATGNPGCLMQLGAGLRRAGSAARAVHPIDLLDASYAARAP
jgi:glycolate oxidase iron-sulfur subunit